MEPLNVHNFMVLLIDTDTNDTLNKRLLIDVNMTRV